MTNLIPHTSRRDFLRATTTSLGAMAAAGPTIWTCAATSVRRPKVAAIFTEFTYRSHAHVILENFLEPYLFNGQLTDPGVDVVSFYADQMPESDMAKKVAADYQIPLYQSIDQALCLGGQELAVDAVLSIGEHGNYPKNELGQHQYPRKEFFDQIVKVMKRSDRFVPLYNDKHLSYRWDWAKEMADTCSHLDIPFMAGSSVPLAQRQPALEIPAGKPMEEAISIHGGGVESYDFHALEVLQSMIESRQGGETGVSRVEFLDTQALWKAADEGRWSRELATAALQAGPTLKGLQPGVPIGRLEDLQELWGPAHGVLVQYRDGMRGLALKLDSSGTHWHFACRLTGENQPKATSFYVGPWDNRNLFKALSHAIQHHFIHGQAPYPVERTLLVSGILDASMQSRQLEGQPLNTPQLEISYTPRDFQAFREMGASWKILDESVPQPPGICPNGEKRGEG
jgi:hypothetical protein